MTELEAEPIQQQPWYYQIDPERINKKKSMQFSVFDLITSYDQQYFICDDCGEELGRECEGNIMNQNRIDHIIQIINDSVSRVCDKCYENDKKHGRVLGVIDTSDKGEKK